MTTGRHGRFYAGGGMVYGGISAKNNTTQTAIGSAGVPVQVVTFDTNGPSNWTTPDHTNDHITILKPGDYLVIVTATIESVSGGGITMGLQVEKNNGATDVDPLHLHRDMAGGGGDVGSVSTAAIVTLAASDTVELWIFNATSTTNLIVEDVVLTVLQVGG